MSKKQQNVELQIENLSLTQLSQPSLDSEKKSSQESEIISNLHAQSSHVDVVTFDEYRSNWLEDVRVGQPSTLELGQRFGRKLLTQWLDIDTTLDDLDLVYCDGTGDGGIDIAYLYRGRSRSSDSDSPSEGDVWYLVQSKYGSAFRGVNTILEESRKVIDTLEGRHKHLSSLTEELLERLTKFRSQTSDLDRLVLIFATEDSLSGEEQRVLNDVRTIGRERIGAIFDVDSVSIRTIYQRILQNKITEISSPIGVTIRAKLDNSGQDLRVGTVTLLELYNFLKAYKEQTGDLNLLYEKNVRRSLGNRTRVNSKIRKTLQESPEQFGLYNNGITIVVTDFRDGEKDTLHLIEPYIVNGCQTTQMIWEVCLKELGSGGTGISSKSTKWYQKADRGVVVTKIVKVGPTGTNLLRDIARYTNSQNAIREQDFLALESDFTVWAEQMKKTYDVFLEIQRGEWDSQRAFQKQHPHTHRFEQHANAFDLLKVYGAGWLRQPGIAFSDNATFVPPSGTVYGQIIKKNQDNGDAFGVEDLYTAYCLQKSADTYGFGRRTTTDDNKTRRQTRFLFYMIVLELLNDIFVWKNMRNTLKETTYALLKLYEPSNEAVVKVLLDFSMQLIDEYLISGRNENVFAEPIFVEQFNNDVGAYLQWSKLGRPETEKDSPNLYKLISDYRRVMGMNLGGQPSARDSIAQIIKP